MHHTDLVVDKQPISIGFYSDTYMAVLKVSGRCVTVQKCHPDYKKEQCLAGAEILKQCQHQNIVDFIGVCARGRPIYIITELMFGGNLVHYLQENKDSINTSQLISFCRHTASGMEYLTSSNYIHRDLQAANCMVDKFGNNLTLKISDFHLAKKITSGRFKSDANELKNIAVKWTAPEVCKCIRILFVCYVIRYMYCSHFLAATSTLYYFEGITVFSLAILAWIQFTV